MSTNLWVGIICIGASLILGVPSFFAMRGLAPQHSQYYTIISVVTGNCKPFFIFLLVCFFSNLGFPKKGL